MQRVRVADIENLKVVDPICVGARIDKGHDQDATCGELGTIFVLSATHGHNHQIERVRQKSNLGWHGDVEDVSGQDRDTCLDCEGVAGLLTIEGSTGCLDHVESREQGCLGHHNIDFESQVDRVIVPVVRVNDEVVSRDEVSRVLYPCQLDVDQDASWYDVHILNYENIVARLGRS